MWKLSTFVAACRRPARRRPARAISPIEGLELRQMLSATGGSIPAEAAMANAKAVPKINVAGNGYTFNDGIGHMDISQDGLNIHGTIVRPGDDPNGTFDATFKSEKAKVAKGTGVFTFQDEPEPFNVKFKIKFKPAQGGGYNFTYRYR